MLIYFGQNVSPEIKFQHAQPPFDTLIDKMLEKYVSLNLHGTTELENIVPSSRLDPQQLIQLLKFQFRDSEQREQIGLSSMAATIVT